MGKIKRGRRQTIVSKTADDSDDGNFGHQKIRKQPMYEPSDSEDDYTHQEKLLLENIRSKSLPNRPSKKQAVMDLPSEDDEDEDNGEPLLDSRSNTYHVDDSDEDMDSDIEGKNDDFDGLPDQKAWGKNRKNYYSTDYVDQDYGGFDGEDAEMAELEEKEARELQQRLAAELDDTDFTLDVFNRAEIDVPKSKNSTEFIKTDLSQLTSKQKLSLLEKEAPELIGIISEFREMMSEVIQRLGPAMTLVQGNQVESPQLEEYIKTKYYLANNYALNIGFYLLLRAQRIPVAAHPVVKRLLQYRQLLSQLQPVENLASVKLNKLLEASMSAGGTHGVLRKKSTPQQLNIISTIRSTSSSENQKKENIGKIIKETHQSGSRDDKEDKKIKEISGRDSKVSRKKTAEMPWQNSFDGEDSEDVPWNTEFDEDQVADEIKVGGSQDGESKRAITWEMAKNKGLAPRRKKEDRNPRVKHRNKFRKAKIRRKGQVREPRTEMQRYGGEFSGIKTTVSKSIKLK